jgi:hypothetical protein
MNGWEQLTSGKSADPLRGIPFRGNYGWRRMRNSSQWDQCYRGIIGWYLRTAYLARNPFFVEPYVNDEGKQL